MPPSAAVTITGNGPHLVLVHATATDRAGWGVLPWLLRDRFRVVRYDRRGCGHWPLGDGAHAPSIADHAADLADLLVSLPDAPGTVVCGASLGATVALEMLRSRPGLAHAAVLWEPAILASDDPAAPPGPLLAEIRALGSAGRERDAALRFMARMAPGEGPPGGTGESPGRSDWRAVWRDLAAAADFRPRLPGLRLVRLPVLLLAGERSSPALRAAVDDLAGVLPRASRAVLPGANHVLSNRAQWESFADRVRGFTATLDLA